MGGKYLKGGLIGRRDMIKIAASGVGLTTVGGASASSDDGFANILGTDPSGYPTVGLYVDVDTDAGRDGKLTEDDFTVYEGGEKRPITDFSFSSTALDLVFVFDDSGSMSDEIATMKREVKSLTDQIASSGIDTRYGLVSFRDSPQIDLDLTDSASALKDTVDSLSADGGGDFPEDNFDSIQKALSLGFRDSAQKVVIDITDATSHHEGDGSGYSSNSLSEVATDLRKAGVSFISVSNGFDDPKASLKVLAQKTGGLWIDINDADFNLILERITEIIVNTYILKYESKTPAGSIGDVSTEVTDPNRGTDKTTAKVSVPKDAGPTIPREFTELRSEKLELANQIDTNSLGFINDTDKVTPVLDSLRGGIESGSIDGEAATSGVDRLLLGEQVTDAVLAGAGPGSSEHDADTNLVKKTAESAVNPMIELLFAGISIVRAARHLPFVGGAAKRAARAIADTAADAAGMISETLERIIRAQGEDAGFALLGEVERRAKEEGKPIATSEFEDARGQEVDPLIEDNRGVLFNDFLFSEEYDWRGRPTTPLDDSLSRLIDGVDPESGMAFSGSDSAAKAAADSALDDIKHIQTVTADTIEENESILKAVGIISSVLATAGFVAGLTGIGSPVGAVLAAAAGLLGLGVSVPLTMANWGLGVHGILETRFRHQNAVPAILNPDGGA